MRTPLRLYTAFFVLGVHLVVGQRSNEGTCHRMEVPLCSTMSYSMAFMPNKFGHTRMDDAELQISTFTPLMQYGCSEALRPFLCATYFPPCSARGGGLEPCAPLCRKARDDCTPILIEFGYPWPSSLDCDSLPEHYRCYNKQ